MRSEEIPQTNGLNKFRFKRRFQIKQTMSDQFSKELIFASNENISSPNEDDSSPFLKLNNAGSSANTLVNDQGDALVSSFCMLRQKSNNPPLKLSLDHQIDSNSNIDSRGDYPGQISNRSAMSRNRFSFPMMPIESGILECDSMSEFENTNGD